MHLVACVLVCACVAWTSAQVQQLGYYEDDICKQEGGTLWTCTKPEACVTAKQKWMTGIKPREICGFDGKIPILCCEPEEKSTPKGTKSEQMCKKYGEAVFVQVIDELSGKPMKESTCVDVEPLIILGKEASPREYPHMALIGFGNKDYIRWLCGGSLISERFVMSAAHCSQISSGPAKWVRLGEYNKASTKDDGYTSSPVDFEIEERINHPDYVQNYNDIALYRLKTKVRFNEYMRPACLQTEHRFSKTYAIATGWGTTERGNSSDILLKVNLTLTSRKECSNLYQSILGSRGGIKDESQICAGDLNTGKDTCNGDSGGPLQLRLAEPYCMYSIIGITSFGPKRCGDGSRPGVYTRVSHYVPWIESIVWP